MSRPALRIEYPLTRELERDMRDVLTNAHVARKWTDDILRKHGLETLDAPEGEALSWGTVPTPKGHVLVVSPVAECTRDAVGDEQLTPLPDGTRVEELGWEVDGDAWNRPPDGEPDEPEGHSVVGEDLPSVARALVTGWWAETSTAGSVRARPPALDARGWVRHDAALEYADALERTARDLRAAVERSQVADATRRGDYSAALRALSDRMSGDAAIATDRAADIVGSGQGRVASGAELGMADREAWVLTSVPPGDGARTYAWVGAREV